MGHSKHIWCCRADLEYHKAHNDELNGEGLVDTLLAIVANQLKVIILSPCCQISQPNHSPNITQCSLCLDYNTTT